MAQPELTFIKNVGARYSDGSRQALYRCSCGKTTVRPITRVNRRMIISCGCANKGVYHYNLKHGLRIKNKKRSKEMDTWKHMRQRCNNSRNPNYKNYGARGISVCSEWDEFTKFFSDMGAAPSPSHSIDRIDVDGNYSAVNCRWATSTEQNNNIRNNINITCYSITMTASQWARALEVPPRRIIRRVSSGWSDHDALFKPRIDCK